MRDIVHLKALSLLPKRAFQFAPHDGFCKDRQRHKWRCPIIRKKWQITCDSPCSDSSYGRIFYTREQDNLRFFTRIPRGSTLFKARYRRRTAAERCFKRLKEDYLLERKTKTRTSNNWYFRARIFSEQKKPTWPKNKPKSIKSKDVGDSLEILAHYIFSCTDGIFIPKGSWANEISQIDNILYLTCHQCFLINWTTYNIVECKNWSNPLTKQGINDFIAKLRDSKQNVGILFSQKGITGGDEQRDAKGKVLLAAHDGIIVIIINNEDLQSLIDGKNVFELLEQKHFERSLSPA